MISSKLTRRLQELEAQLLPAGPPHVIQLVWVSSDGTKEDGPRIVLPQPAGRDCAWQRKGRWRP